MLVSLFFFFTPTSCPDTGLLLSVHFYHESSFGGNSKTTLLAVGNFYTSPGYK